MKLMEFDPILTIQEAECSTDLKRRASLLKSAIDYMVSHCDSQSADMEYAKGYAWYLYPFECIARDEQTELHLKNALKINPLHKFAKLYLAYYYYDHKNFSIALDLLTDFSPTEFGDTNGQYWRDAKNAELILCCKLYLDDIQGIKNAIQRLYESMTKLESEMNPEPTELVEALRNLMRSAIRINNAKEPEV
ncbi:MAG: hypothetical protein LBV29_00775 [Azoarcus sp.]|jgi:hypothetical protein|nr:hypothetical protein [Azoarcus sp.]